jgi:hypothetical protein
MNPSVAARRSQASQPGRMSPSTTICREGGAFAVGLSLAFLLLDPALTLEAAFQFTNMPLFLYFAYRVHISIRTRGQRFDQLSL